ncbi:MAG: hypothetical protein HY243_00325 [Proteobacteria bacterium]|nr:hypothetical protein [Pseudomonadota bacterium]
MLEAAKLFSGVAEATKPFSIIAEAVKPFSGVAEATKPFSIIAEAVKPFSGVAEATKPFSIIAETVRPFSGVAASAINAEQITLAAGTGATTTVQSLVSGLLEDATVSQRKFWRFYDEILNRQPDVVIFDGQQRLIAFEFKRARNSLVHGTDPAVAYLSAKHRAEILSDITRYVGEVDRAVSLAELRVVLVSAVTPRAKILLSFVAVPFISGVPSTRAWVHSFMLWTGISPPRVVTFSFSITTNATCGEINDHFGSQTICHRRRHFDRRTYPGNSRGRPSRRSSLASCSHAGRHKCFRQSRSNRGRSPRRASSRKVGNQLCHVRHWA